MKQTCEGGERTESGSRILSGISVTRWWNKKLPNFPQYCPKSSQNIFDKKVGLFEKAHKYQKWATFGKKCLQEIKKSSNLVTLELTKSIPGDGKQVFFCQKRGIEQMQKAEASSDRKKKKYHQDYR